MYFIDDEGNPKTTSKHYHLGDRVVGVVSFFIGMAVLYLWFTGK